MVFRWDFGFQTLEWMLGPDSWGYEQRMLPCHFCKQSRLQPESHQPLQQAPVVYPEGNSRWRKTGCPMPQVTQPPPTVHPKGNSRWRKIRHWLYIVKMYIKGIISMSPDSCIFPYKKKKSTKMTNLRYLGWEAIVISNNLLMFCYMSSFSQQKCLYILAPRLFGRVPQLSERLYPGCKSSEKK